MNNYQAGEVLTIEGTVAKSFQGQGERQSFLMKCYFIVNLSQEIVIVVCKVLLHSVIPIVSVDVKPSSTASKDDIYGFAKHWIR